MRCLLLTALISAAAASTVDVSIVNSCDASCKVSDVKIDAPTSAPNPGTFSFSGTGTTSIGIDSSVTNEVVMKLGGLKVLDTKVSGCGEQTITLPLGLGSVVVTGPACPVKSGGSIKLSGTVSNKIKLPSKVVATSTFKQGADTLVALTLTITPVNNDESASDDEILRLLGLTDASPGVVDVSVADTCDSSCKITDVKINAPKTAPNPGSFSFNGTGMTSVEVDNTATNTIVVNLGGAKVLDKTVSGCGDQTIQLPLHLGTVEIVGPSCPIKGGSSVALSGTISNAIKLPAKAVATSTLNQGSEELVQITLTVTPETTTEVLV